MNLCKPLSYIYDGISGVQLSQTVTDISGNVTSHQTYEHDGNLRQTGVRAYVVPTGTTSTTGLALHRRSQSILDAAGRATASRTFDGAGVLLSESITTYNVAGQTISSADALGRASAQEYDDQGRSVKTTYPDSTFTTVVYDAEGRQISSTDALGRTTTTEHDALGRAVKNTAADGVFTTTAYDAAGRMISATDARGNTTTYSHDAAGRTQTVTNALNQTTTYVYDDAGRQTHMTDALSRTTQTLYDTLGRPLKTILADGTFTETGYDSAGRRISSKDQGGTVTNYEYDAQSRLIAVVDALGHRTEYIYDNFGRQTQQKDALGRTTSYQYDNLGRRIGRTLPLGQQESVAYDAAGQMLSRTDFNGRTSTYTYDLMGRVLSRTPAADFSSEPAITYTYNAKGQQLTMTDATGTTSYSYDTRDRLTQKATPQGTLHYFYDAGSNLTGITTNTSSGAAMGYTYDALNRLATVTDLNNQTTTYNYNEVGNMASTALPNGLTTTYAYNTVNRLQTLTTSKISNQQSVIVNQIGYTLAATGHRLSAQEGGPLSPLSGSRTRTVNYTYDTINRLTSETISASSPPSVVNPTPSGTTTWTHDAVSNRLTQTSTLPGIPNQTHTYDANDRLTTDTYDANGNTLTGTIGAGTTGSGVLPGANTHAPIVGTDTYDSHDRLIGRLASDTSYVQVKYNGEGHRVEQTVFHFDTSTTTTTKWLVDSLNPTGYAQVIEEHRSADLQSAPTLTAVFIYGHDLISQDRQDSTTQQWALSYYGYDGHGTVRYLTNAAGEITDTYDYDAWGQLLATTGTTTNPYLYTGEQYDPVLGLYHLRARMMNPLTGRFWNADTYEGNGADPVSLHKYLYANADPVQGIDPSGNEAISLPSLLTTISLLGAYGPLVGKALVLTVIAVSTAVIIDELLDNYYEEMAQAMAYVYHGVVSGLLTAARVVARRLGLSPGLKIVPQPSHPSFRMPTVASHVASALGVHPRLLTRADPITKKANSRDALAGRASAGFLNSWDEYPFASSYQGGTGSSVVSVPLHENFVQGGIIAGAYLIERITIGTPYIVIVL